MDRRDVLIGGGAAIAMPAAAVTARAQTADKPAPPRKEYLAARQELLKGRTVTYARVTLTLPRISESGNSVPLNVSVESPMTQQDHVRVIHILSEQNPYALVARFHFNPGPTRPDVDTKIRLATTQRIHAIAEMSDGRLFEGVAETVVALAACLD
ncbi:MAG: sulfur oxidation protein SoxY [Hyphomicrobiaceae bacterium]|nr:sulfur oxidation protein SoxY [Hyphomicrobiaceae bacterium]